MKNITIIALLVLSVAACKEENKLSFDTVESARVQANENSEFNAKQFRQEHPEYSGFSISMRGDSTQSPKCGQGDGWASIDLVNIEKNVKQPLKCSTVSAATGCMTDADFKQRSYAAQDGQCNADIPFPLPKIQK
jgi:FtsZ-binding cell division protein ZapB